MVECGIDLYKAGPSRHRRTAPRDKGVSGVFWSGTFGKSNLVESHSLFFYINSTYKHYKLQEGSWFFFYISFCTQNP